MNNLKIELLNRELKNLEERSEIIGSAIVNRNGLLITSILPRDIDVRKFGAMAATMFGAIETAISSLEKTNIYNVAVEFPSHQIVSIPAGDEFIFVSLLNLDVNLGLVLIEIEETIKKIKELSSG